MTRNASLHRWRASDRPMHPAVIVVSHVQGNGRRKVFELLAEPERQTDEPSHERADRQVVPLYMRRAEIERIHPLSHRPTIRTEEQAAEYRARFFRTYPRLAAWHKRVGLSKEQLVETRTIAGRRRLNVGHFTEKLNTPVQGSGADGLKVALALLWERRDRAPGAFPIMAVHDEIVVEADAERAEEAKAWLMAAMIDAMSPLASPVPVEVEAEIGVSWGEC